MIEILAFLFGLLGFLFGARCYVELYRWAKQCQNAKIAIAHKRRVQLNAPLSEWLTWANQLSRDEASTGRVIYRNGHVSVAILRPQSRKPIRGTLKRIRNARKTTTAA